MKLRPVTFRYKQDREGTKQFGLVGEEVAKVYPELVVYSPDGKVMTVRYQELIPMLLNQAQRQSKQIQEQAEQNRRLSAEVAQLRAMFQQVMARSDGKL
jgi:hypothetical protein